MVYLLQVLTAQKKAIPVSEILPSLLIQVLYLQKNTMFLSLREVERMGLGYVELSFFGYKFYFGNINPNRKMTIIGWPFICRIKVWVNFWKLSNIKHRYVRHILQHTASLITGVSCDIRRHRKVYKFCIHLLASMDLWSKKYVGRMENVTRS